MTMMMGTLGGTFGGRPCAMLVNTIGWRSSMLVGAVVGSCIAIAAWMIIRDHPNTLKRNQKGAEHANASLLEGLKIVAANPQNWLIGLYGCMMYLPLSAFADEHYGFFGDGSWNFDWTMILYFAAAKEINPDYISGTTIGFTNCLVMMSAEGAPIYDLTTYKVAFSAVSVALLVSWVIVQYVRETYNHVEADTN
eukprot:gene14781-14912_t